MGEFYINLDICAKDGSSAKTLRVKANAGATYTRLPAGLLRELGWEPDPLPWGWPYPMGYKDDWELGEVKLRLDGKDYLHSVIFAADDSEPVLGNRTATGFVLEADEVNQCLIPRKLIYL